MDRGEGADQADQRDRRNEPDITVPAMAGTGEQDVFFQHVDAVADHRGAIGDMHAEFAGGPVLDVSGDPDAECGERGKRCDKRADDDPDAVPRLGDAGHQVIDRDQKREIDPLDAKGGGQ